MPPAAVWNKFNACNSEGSMLYFTLYPDSEEICSDIFTYSNKFLLTCDF